MNIDCPHAQHLAQVSPRADFENLVIRTKSCGAQLTMMHKDGNHVIGVIASETRR